MPLASQRTFSVLFNSSNAVRNVRGSPQGNIKYNVTSRYRSQSLSPVRDPHAPPPPLQQPPPQLQNSPYAVPQVVFSDDVAKRVRQQPAMAYSTRAVSYDASAARSSSTRELPASLEEVPRMPFENSLRRYKRIENKRTSKPTFNFNSAPAVPLAVPVAVAAASQEEGETGAAHEEPPAPESQPAPDAIPPVVALPRANLERRGPELPSLGSLRMRTPRTNPRESTTRFMPAPMTTVRVISTTAPPPAEGQLPLGHPLNQPRLKPNLAALSHPRRPRSPPTAAHDGGNQRDRVRTLLLGACPGQVCEGRRRELRTEPRGLANFSGRPRGV